MALYRADDPAWARRATLASIQRTPVQPFPPTDITITDLGCWMDSDTERIMPEGLHRPQLQYWDCAYEAAKMGTEVFGVQAGNQCWAQGNAGRVALGASRSPGR